MWFLCCGLGVDVIVGLKLNSGRCILSVCVFGVEVCKGLKLKLCVKMCVSAFCTFFLSLSDLITLLSSSCPIEASP